LDSRARQASTRAASFNLALVGSHQMVDRAAWVAAVFQDLAQHPAAAAVDLEQAQPMAALGVTGKSCLNIEVD
jgi:hypothetical protein